MFRIALAIFVSLTVSIRVLAQTPGLTPVIKLENSLPAPTTKTVLREVVDLPYLCASKGLQVDAIPRKTGKGGCDPAKNQFGQGANADAIVTALKDNLSGSSSLPPVRAESLSSAIKFYRPPAA